MANLGAAMRWTAALAELHRFTAVEEELAARFLSAFSHEVRRLAQATPGTAPLDDAGRGVESLVPIVIARNSECPAPPDRVAKLYADLREPTAGHARIVHVGQPVQLAERTVLRVCACAPQISALAVRMAGGASFESAFAPVSADLHAAFAKIGRLLEGEGA
jgi:hypothetical protein